MLGRKHPPGNRLSRAEQIAGGYRAPSPRVSPSGPPQWTSAFLSWTQGGPHFLRPRNMNGASRSGSRG